MITMLVTFAVTAVGYRSLLAYLSRGAPGSIRAKACKLLGGAPSTNLAGGPGEEGG